MARPTHRVDLLLVPAPDVPIGRGEALLERLVAAEVISDDGAPAAQWSRWAPSGFNRVTLDRPPREALYANRTGGFRVACPSMGTSVVGAFNQAIGAWRDGGERSMSCPACGRDHDLDGLSYQPPAAFGRFAIVTADIEAAALGAEAMVWAREHLGARVRTVWRR